MTATARRQPAAPLFHWTDDIAGLESVFDPRLNRVVWRRPHLPLRGPADDWPQQTGRRMRAIASGAATPAAVAAELSLEPASALAADVAMLCELFATITGASTLGLRLEITDCATCPRFHSDRVTVRLMTTYRGPGTEWLEGEEVHRAAVHDVLLAKGESWTGADATPCLHRSPVPAPGQTRVLLTLDAL